MMLQSDETTVAIPAPQVGPILGKDVGVGVYFHQVPAGFGGSITCPQLLQVRRASLP